MAKPLAHLPALDSLRGIAVLLVMGLHFTPDIPLPFRLAEWVRKIPGTGGWIGVDLFFVLSGFLITRILLNSKDDLHYFRNFYARRALRIFPLYFFFLLVVFGLLPHIVASPSFSDLQQTQWYHWFYVTNFGWFVLGPRAFNSDIVNVGPLWSLSIEEHFYLVWPAIVLFVSRIALARICVGLAMSSIVLRCLASAFLPADAMPWYLTPLRWDGLAIGAFIATLADPYRYRVAALFVASGGATFLFAFLVIEKGLWAHNAMMETVGVSVVAMTFGATMISVVTSKSSWLGRSSVLRFFGRYSYGLYIIHGALMPVLLSYEPSWLHTYPVAGAFGLCVLRIAVTLPIALLSWHFVEAPALRLKRAFSPDDRLSRKHLEQS